MRNPQKHGLRAATRNLLNATLAEIEKGRTTVIGRVYVLQGIGHPW